MDHTPDEKNAIKAFAAADKATASLRDAAISAHRSFIMRATSGRPRNPLPYGNPYFEFMREVDTPVPDLLLRRRYRQEVLAAPEMAPPSKRRSSRRSMPGA